MCALSLTSLALSLAHAQREARRGGMAPKKGGKDKKGDKGKKDGDASAEMTEKELLEQAMLRIESLEQQLVWREEKTQTALAGQKELQERITHYHADFEREKEEIFDISADMTRQYKGMQEELIAQVNKLQQTIAEQKDELERSQLQLEEVRRQMAVELALKDAEIKEQKDKMEDMAVEFGEVCRSTAKRMRTRTMAALARVGAHAYGCVSRSLSQMLKETLDKMSEKIEITNQGWEEGAGNDISRRLQEHKMGVGP